MGFWKELVKANTTVGWVNSHDFPTGTRVNVTKDEGEKAFLLTLPNKKEIKITHDMIESATVLAMGVIDIKQNGKKTTMIHGTKYLFKLKDGRVGVLTAGLGNTSNVIESILF